MQTYLHYQENPVLDTQGHESAIAILYDRINSEHSLDFLSRDWIQETDIPENIDFPDEILWDYFVAYYLSPKLVKLGVPFAKWEQVNLNDLPEDYAKSLLNEAELFSTTLADYDNIYCEVYRGRAVKVELITAFLKLVWERYAGFSVIYGYKIDEKETPIEPEEQPGDKQLFFNIDILAAKTYVWDAKLNQDEKKKNKTK